MTESTLISAEENANVFVDAWDEGGVWLSIQTRFGGAHCTLTPDNVRQMITALQAVLEETE